MNQLSPAAYFTQQDQYTLLDVRSPAEYQQGHIDGAVSLPLFDDTERAEVGTLYKRTSPDAALLRGLELVGNKMRPLVEQARTAAPSNRVVVQCWRGGQRSASVGWLLEQAGFQVSQLSGGYKAYRAYARQYLAESPHELRVLSGPTGSGKTWVLLALRELGASVVDLEGLANHKGSSFGSLGEDPQPSSEAFENMLFAALHVLPTDRPVWVEDESRLIGRVCQPDAFYDRLVTAPAVELRQPLDWRVDNLVRDYAGYPPEGLAAAFTRLRKKLGGQHLQRALEALEQQDFATACRIALVYYDKAYAHYGERKENKPVRTVEATSPHATDIARQLLVDA
ncbi:tRNA 2-selenouridine synthase [Neolewinella maritima]|uniref:tRNA 2-selenouridine synthase n=1 Tax=Neolewinella maritima TaxID=1383882 RepID=A0ABN8F7X3_9BACT|nr:tRNA 2-selenouridine(34) synthase MnmH [Neolewinella maritima]CAH1000234.1 tRNA 2-selenouridine synthase [Neolewinella maritima]